MPISKLSREEMIAVALGKREAYSSQIGYDGFDIPWDKYSMLKNRAGEYPIRVTDVQEAIDFAKGHEDEYFRLMGQQLEVLSKYGKVTPLTVDNLPEVKTKIRDTFRSMQEMWIDEDEKPHFNMTDGTINIAIAYWEMIANIVLKEDVLS